MQEILNKKIDKYFESLVTDLQTFIKIPSVLDEERMNNQFPFGPIIDEALRYALAKGEELGFDTNYLEGYAGYIEMGSGKEMIGVLCHVDVVPEGTGWSFSPYGAEISDGKLYGRGSVDDKGPTMAVLYGLKAIQDTELPVSKRVRLILGTDEETGGRCMKYYLEHDEPPTYGFSPDAEFPIIYAEKGILRFEFKKEFSPSTSPVTLVRLQGGTKVNIVPDAAEATLVGIELEDLQEHITKLGLQGKLHAEEDQQQIILKARGVSAHASYPEEGENALQLLLNFLSHLDLGPSLCHQFIFALAEQFGMEINGKTLGLNFKDDISGSLTLNMAVAQFDLEQGSVKFDIRYPVTENGEAIIAKLQSLAHRMKAKLIINQHKLPLYVEKDKDFIKTMQQVYQECTGDEPRLLSIGGGTYCRYVKNTVSFGPVFPGQKELAHQKNEFIALKDLRKLAKIYAQTIYELIK